MFTVNDSNEIVIRFVFMSLMEYHSNVETLFKFSKLDCSTYQDVAGVYIEDDVTKFRSILQIPSSGGPVQLLGSMAKGGVAGTGAGGAAGSASAVQRTQATNNSANNAQMASTAANPSSGSLLAQQQVSHSFHGLDSLTVASSN